MDEEKEKNLKWYVVHTYSGYEKRAKLSLQQRIKDASVEAFFGDLEKDILIPVEEVVELKKGEKKTSERKFFPGYMFIRMNLTEDTWHLVKATPKITGFVGNALRPKPVPESEVLKISQQMIEGIQRPKPLIEYEYGEEVRVVDGPFMNFDGIVEEVNPDKGKVRVMVKIFGRSTPVELDFLQVQKKD
jgi:transcriptional antiterminator NusG